MNINKIDYLELSAPLDTVWSYLNHPTIWDAVPRGGERTGNLWRWGEELYTTQFASDYLLANKESDEHQYANEPIAKGFLKWQATPLTVAGHQVTIEISLYDGVVSTLALVRMSLRRPDSLWPWEQLRATATMTTLVHDCRTMMQTMINEREGASDSQKHRPQVGHGETAKTFSLEAIRQTYPETVAAFEAMGAISHLEHAWKLSRRWERMMQGEYHTEIYRELNSTDMRRTTDYDLIYAGGGMGLLNAAVMACIYGWRVLVFDDQVVGNAHREWNISRNELQALVNTGLVTWDELAPVIMREYQNGLVSFYSGPYGNIPHAEVWMPEVLNLAIDSHAILHLMRHKIEQAGGTILDWRGFRRVQVSAVPTQRVEVDLAVLTPGMKNDRSNQEQQPEETYSARLLIDGMGSTSPLALLRYRGHPFDGFCPTVGTIISGLQEGNGPREHNPNIGDILISVADVQSERQFIWEGFPGRNDELTVYLFYYIALEKECGQAVHQRWSCYSLLELYEQYFALLPSYKKPGPDFRHLRPVYGYIPGRHQLQANSTPLLRGVLPLGDASALQSPLTYCGFGSHIRNLHRTTSLLDYALQRDALEPQHLRHISAFQLNVALNWPFSYFMQAWGKPQSMNELQNVFLGVLDVLGTSPAMRFFQDRATWSDYSKIVWLVMFRYPVIMLKVWEVLKPMGFLRWERDYAFFTLAAMWAMCGRMGGALVEQALTHLSDQISPEMALRVRNQYGEWRAMGWMR